MSNRSFYSARLIGGGITSLMLLTAPAVPAADSTAASADSQGGGLEEIVVTANRREQSEMSVGVSMDVLGGDELTRLSLRDAAQITNFVPNMVESAIFGPGVSPNLAIRGVGMNDYNAASESPIAGYIDNVYIVYGGASPCAALANLPTWMDRCSCWHLMLVAT